MINDRKKETTGQRGERYVDELLKTLKYHNSNVSKIKGLGYDRKIERFGNTEIKSTLSKENKVTKLSGNEVSMNRNLIAETLAIIRINDETGLVQIRFIDTKLITPEMIKFQAEFTGKAQKDFWVLDKYSKNEFIYDFKNKKII